MKRGHGGFGRARSLKLNSTQIKISPASSADYMKAVTDGMNHITSMTKSVIAQNRVNMNNRDNMRDEEIIPLQSMNIFNGDFDKNYKLIE